jgi:sugar phosphate permease
MDGYVLFGMGAIFGVLMCYLMSDLVFEPKEFDDESERNDY